MQKKSGDDLSDTSSNESNLRQLKRKEEQLKELELQLQEQQKELKPRILQIGAREKSIVKKESFFFEDKKQINSVIEELKKEKQILETQTNDKKLLFHQVADTWHKHFERLLHIKAEISSEIKHISQLIESDLQLLHEKEHQLTQEVESVNKEKDKLNKKKEQLARVRILEEQLKNQETHFKREKEAILKVKQLMKKKQQKPMPLISKQIEFNKPPKVFKPKLLKIPSEKKESKPSIEDLLSTAKKWLDLGDFEKTEESIKKVEHTIKKIKDLEKQTNYKFALKELKTNLKLARLA